MDFYELFHELDELTTQAGHSLLSPEELQRFNELAILANEVGELNLRDANFIADNDFVDYAKEFAEEMLPVSPNWPYTCIDWDEAARELQMDYTSVDWEGTTYYYLPEN